MQASARLSSSAAFRKVIVGVSSATTRSCYRTSRGKAHAAPLPAQEPPTKGQKRIWISKQERRARTMEFIENYRALNDGKFPTIKYVRQQIGGGPHTVRLLLQEMRFNDEKLLKTAPLQETVEVIEPSLPMDEGKAAQFPVHSRHKDDNGKARKHDMDTPETCKTADAPAVQTKNESFNNLEDKPDPGNRQKEIEASKVVLKNSIKSLDANDSNTTDESGSFMVNEAKTHAREENQKLEESAKMGLLGSLKSFAYGIRNFWKYM